MPKATLMDIASAAGVSLATVDRVMNGRTGVAPRTQTLVLTAAEQLGVPLGPPQSGQRQAPLPHVRLAFLLPGGTNSFIHQLGEEVHRQADDHPNVRAEVVTISGFDPASLAEGLRDLKGKVDGVAVVALDHPYVRAALRTLAEGGTAIVTLASDISNVPHLGYIGIDNSQAGRLAGYLIGRLVGANTPTKVAFFAGSLSYRGHQEREMGFRQILSEDFPQIDIIARVEVQEDRTRARVEMTRLLKQHPDLAGVYNAGGATEGIAEALVARNRARDCVFVAHDATAGNKRRLLHGTLDAVIDQNARIEIREALASLIAAARKQHHRLVPPRLQVIFRENIPDD